MATKSKEWASGASDAKLISRTRTGDRTAYAELWQRHARAGMQAAYGYRNLADPEDLVAESFMQILRIIQAGKGPTTAFRPYLYTVIKNTALKAGRQASVFVEIDLELLPVASSTERSVEQALDNNLLVTAYRALPDRWQSVLWYTEVDNLPPQQVAVLLGMTPNAVSALAYRARRALRAAWLQLHIDDSQKDELCRTTLSQAGAYFAGALKKAPAENVARHLADCISCRIITEEAEQVSTRLAIVLIPLTVGAAAATGYFQYADSGVTMAAPAMPSGLSKASATPHATLASKTGAVLIAGTVIVAGAITAMVITASMTPTALPIQQPTIRPTSTPQPSSTSEPTAKPSAPETPPPSETPIPTPAPPVATIWPPAQQPTPTPAPPVATITLGSPTITGTDMWTRNPAAQIAGTGTPSIVIVISRAQEVLGTTTVNSDGNWLWTASGLNEDANALDFVQHMTGFIDSAPASLIVRLDTTAPQPPVLVDTWTAIGTARPPFAGTGEPGATIQMTLNDGTAVAQTIVDSTGMWSIPALQSLDPSTSSLNVRQTDRVGNVSAPSVGGPFSFQPLLATPTVAPGATSIPISVVGWPGTMITIVFDGVPLGQLTVDPNGDATGTVTGASFGTHTVSAAYVDNFPADGVTPRPFTVTVTTTP